MQKHICKVASIVAILLCSAPAFAAQKSRATIQSDITTNLASNKPITAADLRTAMSDLADSAYITLTDTVTVAEGGTNITTYATGDLPYASTTNTLSKLAIGTNGQYLKVVSGAPAWAASGDAVGPSSATDNAVARFDTTTGKLIQNSVLIVDDSGNTSGIGSLAAKTLAVYNSGALTNVDIRAGTNTVLGNSQPVLSIRNSSNTITALVRADGLFVSAQMGTLDDYSAVMVDNSIATTDYPRGLNLGSSSGVYLGSGAWYAAKDTGISRVSSGVLGVGGNTAGSTAGELRATKLSATNFCNNSGSSCKTQASLVTNEDVCYALSDGSTDLTTGYKQNGFLKAAATLNSVRAYVNTASTGSTIIVDINEAGSTMMSATKLSIDASEKTSGTAATAAVLSDTSIAANAELTFDIDQVGSTIKGKGLVVCLNITY